MNDDPNLSRLLPETAALIVQDMGIMPISTDQTIDYGLLRSWLADVLDDLLANNPDYLRWMLYRLDVAQHKALPAFQASKRYTTALQLADLIIARECEKVKTRQWYREQYQNGNDNNPTSNNADNHADTTADRWWCIEAQFVVAAKI